MLLAFADAIEIVELLTGDWTAEPHAQKICVPPDRVERSAELVRHRREKLRFCGIRGFGFRRSPRICNCLLLQSSALSEIAGDLRVADEGSVGVADGGKNDACPEHVAVLPHADSFFLENSISRGDLQLDGWLARVDLGPRVEDGEVLADDLACGITIDSLGAAVPA